MKYNKLENKLMKFFFISVCNAKGRDNCFIILFRYVFYCITIFIILSLRDMDFNSYGINFRSLILLSDILYYILFSDSAFVGEIIFSYVTVVTLSFPSLSSIFLLKGQMQVIWYVFPFLFSTFLEYTLWINC